ncbi:MAG: sufE [Verrucomicrobiaceae bacterium]|nr:sufE [Verrucomicrobiaceae bacterium]
MTVSEKQSELVSDLRIIEDVQERLSAVVSRAARRSLPAELRVDANRVAGCVSAVWLVPTVNDQHCHFAYDADSPMVKGLVGLLCEVYEGGTPADVAATEPTLWEPLGFHKLLSPTRVNGLAAVRARMEAFARSHATL